jgi:hypothetical protein
MGSGRRGAYRELTMSSCPASAMASAEGTGHEPRTAAGMGRSGGAGDDGRTYYGRCSTLGEGSWAEVLDLGDSLGEDSTLFEAATSSGSAVRLSDWCFAGF